MPLLFFYCGKKNRTFEKTEAGLIAFFVRIVALFLALAILNIAICTRVLPGILVTVQVSASLFFF